MQSKYLRFKNISKSQFWKKGVVSDYIRFVKKGHKATLECQEYSQSNFNRSEPKRRDVKHDN